LRHASGESAHPFQSATAASRRRPRADRRRRRLRPAGRTRRPWPWFASLPLVVVGITVRLRVGHLKYAWVSRSSGHTGKPILWSQRRSVRRAAHECLPQFNEKKKKKSSRGSRRPSLRSAAGERVLSVLGPAKSGGTRVSQSLKATDGLFSVIRRCNLPRAPGQFCVRLGNKRKTA